VFDFCSSLVKKRCYWK